MGNAGLAPDRGVEITGKFDSAPALHELRKRVEADAHGCVGIHERIPAEQVGSGAADIDVQCLALYMEVGELQVHLAAATVELTVEGYLMPEVEHPVAYGRMRYRQTGVNVGKHTLGGIEEAVEVR